MPCNQFMLDRIAKTKELIEAYEAAILALTVGGIEEYSLDTGQSKQKVKKYDLPNLNASLDSLLNRLVTLEARCSGAGNNTIGRPCW